MQLQTFKAETMADCLSQVKTAMGAEAIILHTRTYQTKLWMGLRKREVVEITAGKGMRVGNRPRPGQAVREAPAIRESPSARETPSSRHAPLAGTYGRTGVARPAADAGPRSLLDTPAAASAAMLSLTQEVQTLKGMMKDLLVTARQRQPSNVPEELQPYHDQLTTARLSDETVSEIIRTLQKQVRAEHYTDAAYMRERIGEQLEKIILTGGPITRTKQGSPHVAALIGPTGVGKTTTLAKLAANLKLRERKRVGLITLDTYRIAAVDQLRRYAEIIGSPLKVVASADDLRDAIRAMADMEYILIDTAGRSPKDRMKLNELKRILDAAKADEVHLVLSTTSSQECMELAAAQFGEVRMDRMLFTKVDEAATLGPMVNVARKVGKAVSYITTGQDVPDDIETAQGKRLAQLILGEGL